MPPRSGARPPHLGLGLGLGLANPNPNPYPNLALLYQAKGDATKEQAMRMLVKMLQSRNEPAPG